MCTWSCRDLSSGQEDPLSFSKQLGWLTSGKPDLVGCAWQTGGSHKLARKHWLGAQLRRQAQGPELYPSAISEDPFTVEPSVRLCSQYSHLNMVGGGVSILAALQPSLPINVMGYRGHVTESVQWIPGMEIPFGQNSPKRSSGVLCKSTHERLLWTRDCPERRAPQSQFRSSFFPLLHFPRTGAGVQEVMKQPPAQAPLPTRGNQMGDYHLLHETGNSPPPIRLHLGPSGHQTWCPGEAINTTPPASTQQPTFFILFICSQILLGTLRGRGWWGSDMDGAGASPEWEGRNSLWSPQGTSLSLSSCLSLPGEMQAEGSSKEQQDGSSRRFPFSLRKVLCTITGILHRPHSHSHPCWKLAWSKRPQERAWGRHIPQGKGVGVEFPECSLDRGEKRHTLHVHLHWPGGSSSASRRGTGKQSTRKRTLLQLLFTCQQSI